MSWPRSRTCTARKQGLLQAQFNRLSARSPCTRPWAAVGNEHDRTDTHEKHPFTDRTRPAGGSAAGIADPYRMQPRAHHKGPTYDYATVSRANVLQHVTASGSLSAVVSVDVGSQVSGKITHLYVDFNSPVHKGQLVAEIDPTVYKAQLQQAQGDLASARADVTLKRQNLRAQEDAGAAEGGLAAGSGSGHRGAGAGGSGGHHQGGGAAKRPGEPRLLQDHRAGGWHRDLAQGGRGPDGHRRHEHPGAVHRRPGHHQDEHHGRYFRGRHRPGEDRPGR